MSIKLYKIILVDVILILPTFVGAQYAQAPQIATIEPDMNELNVPVSANISVAFDIDMDPSSFNDSTFVVNAMRTGLAAGVITYDSLTKTAEFNPQRNFTYGELVTVTLTTGIRSLSGTPLENSLVWCFTAIVNYGTGIFDSLITYPVGHPPQSVFIADFDNDEDLDLAVGVFESIHYDSISILMNNGNGTFAPRINYTDDHGPISLFVADFNRDYYLDLANANYFSENVSVLMNNGDGTFAPVQWYFIDSATGSVTSSDLDGDGDFDLAVTNLYPRGVSVLMNNGVGNFVDFTTYNNTELYGSPSIIAADIENDGDQDLLMVVSSPDSIWILKNDGNGIFAWENNYATGVNSQCLIAADIDGDKDLDLVIADASGDSLSILMNTGDGSYMPRVAYIAGNVQYSVCAADLDADGDLDLATANWVSNNVSILMNNGDGTFAQQVSFLAGDSPISICASDLDGDGDIDLAVVDLAATVSILFNQGEGCRYTTGDINGSDNFNGLDITFGVAYFKNGPPPPYSCECPGFGIWYVAGDVNGSCSYNGLDITYGVNYLKGATSELIPCPDCPPVGE